MSAHFPIFHKKWISMQKIGFVMMLTIQKNNSLIVFSKSSFKKVVYSRRGHWNKIRSSQRYCLRRQIIFTATMIVLEDIFVTSWHFIDDFPPAIHNFWYETFMIFFISEFSKKTQRRNRLWNTMNLTKRTQKKRTRSLVSLVIVHRARVADVSHSATWWRYSAASGSWYRSVFGVTWG